MAERVRSGLTEPFARTKHAQQVARALCLTPTQHAELGPRLTNPGRRTPVSIAGEESAVGIARQCLLAAASAGPNRPRCRWSPNKPRYGYARWPPNKPRYGYAFTFLFSGSNSGFSDATAGYNRFAISTSHVPASIHF